MRWNSDELAPQIEENHKGGRTSVSQNRHRKRFWRNHDHGSYECPDCGRSREQVGRFEVHHIDGNPKNGALDNLVALCHHCHVRRHRRKSIKERLDQMKSEARDI